MASVVIPARNSATVLPEQLAALATQDAEVTWDVLVADNGSTDATAAVVAEAARRFPVPLRLVPAVRRRGANIARNAGARASTGELVLFCDSDDRVGPGWVRSMVDALGSAAMAGGPLEFTSINPPEVRTRAFDVPSSIQEYRGFRYALSANLGVRREVFGCVGWFDESFVDGFDEVDFGYRAHAAGLSVHEAPEAVVHYRLRATRRSLLRQQYRYGRGSRTFLAKHPELHDPALDSLTARVGAVVKLSARLAGSTVAGRADRDRRLAAFAYGLGALDLTGAASRQHGAAGAPPD